MTTDSFREFLREPLDLYCERLDMTLLSEPLNLVSNLAFLIAAAFAFRLYRACPSEQHRRELAVLSLLLVLIGLGSAWFHSFATRLSQIGDVLPIGIFVVLSLLFYIRNLYQEGLALKRPLILVGLCLIVPFLIARLSGLSLYLAKGEAYLGIAPTLLVLALSERVEGRRRRLLWASGLFLLALVFRTLDTPICDIFPKGTHFLWHMTTTLSAYLMASTQAVSGRRRQAESGGSLS